MQRRYSIQVVYQYGGLGQPMLSWFLVFGGTHGTRGVAEREAMRAFKADHPDAAVWGVCYQTIG